MKYVILGNGIAGFTAAKTLREQCSDSEIVLISGEPYLSYSRPMMTKAPLQGFDFRRFLIKEQIWYQDQNITVLTNTRIRDIDPTTKNVFLEDGNSVSYDKCIYSLGSSSFTPPIEGTQEEWVLHVRTLDDIANLRTEQLKAQTAVVIGGGVVGLETAWQLKKAGLQVTVLEQTPNLMGLLLDRESAQILEKIVKKSGIEIKTGVEIDRISEEKQVILKGGINCPSDIVILSCGIHANIEVAVKSGIKVNRAIIVNEKMETNIQDIYACGDCAEYQGVNHGLWEQGIKQAEVAAINASGGHLEYLGIEKEVLFNGMNISLFAIGTLQGNSTVKESHNIESKYFMVNNPNTTGYSYKKYFFDEKYLIGCVLIGDLREMGYVKTAINEKWTMEKFKNEVEKW